MKIVVENIEKKFRYHSVLKDVSFELQSPDSLVITGSNGSGKTTLVKILCGLLSPTNGKVRLIKNGKEIPTAEQKFHFGLVGPYLQLYKDLTAWENLLFFAKVRGTQPDINRLKNLIESVGLKGREHEELKNYSSGMLQRVKYLTAIYHNPEILVLDEPTSNLDEAGKNFVRQTIAAQSEKGMVIIATNEPEEVALGNQRVEIA